MPLPAPVISATLFSSRLLITNVSLLYSSRPPVTPTAAAIACPAFSDGHGTRPAVCSARLAAGYGLWIGFALGDRFVAIARRAVAEHAVLAAGEVVQRIGVLLRIVGNAVGLDVVLGAGPEHFAAVVPGVVNRCAKGVLVDVVAAFALRVANALLAGCLDHPDAVQLPALAVRIDVVGHQFGIHVAAPLQLVIAVGNEHFLLADQLPVEAIHLSREQENLVIERHAAKGRVGRVVIEFGRLTDSALAGGVAPGVARTFHRIEVIPVPRCLPGGTGWCNDARPYALRHRRVTTVHANLVIRFFTGGLIGVSQRGVALVDDIGAVVPIPTVDPLIVEDVVPHHLLTAFGQRKRQATPTVFGDRKAIVDGFAFRALRIALGGRQKCLRECRGAVRRVDVHVIGVGILLEQLHLPR